MGIEQAIGVHGMARLRQRLLRGAAMAATVALLISMPMITADSPAQAVDDGGETPAGSSAPAEPAATEPSVDETPETPAADPADAQPAQPVSPAPTDEPVTDYFDETLRGDDGGAVSFSPGPDDATEAPADARLGAGAEARASKPGRGKVIGDNYPSKYKKLPFPYVFSISPWDQWNFAYRQCTSFVAWRLNSANGVKFSNQYKGLVRWGDAGQWANSARSVGIRVDKKPEVGAVAWSSGYYPGASVYGHVAWVSRVLDNGNIIIEEYNYDWAGAYKTREIKPSAFEGYIHVKDIMKGFSKTPTPTISGTATVGGTITAKAPGWTPKATKLSYQWTRNGAAIPKATKTTYRPVAADVGATLRVEVTGSRTGYGTSTVKSAGSAPVTQTDVDGDGIADAHQLLPFNSDVNGDGRPDSVGFAKKGVRVGLSTGSTISPTKSWTAEFGVDDGWDGTVHQRTLANVNGGNNADIIGFGTKGVYVALSNGAGFNPKKRWTTQFGKTDGWDSSKHPRGLADVDGDGKLDIVGFGSDGAWVGLNAGNGFADKKRWLADFGTSQGWSTDKHPRWLADMNGDGRADIVAASNSGLRVALSTGKGFTVDRAWSTSDLGYGAGWRTTDHPRFIADVNGDGRTDVVGINDAGTYVALNTGSGLAAAKRWSTDFGKKAGWLMGQHPRTVADVNGDNRDDIVGFKNDGAWVALSTGSSFSKPKRFTSQFGSTAWTSTTRPRTVIDANGDGLADIVGYGNDGIRIALSSGSSFGSATVRGTRMDDWNATTYPRSFSIARLAKTTTPGLSGSAVINQTLTASVNTWQHAPVRMSYQWYRNGSAIPGATSRTYRLAQPDVGAQVQVRVTGSKTSFGKTTKASAKSRTVVYGTLTPTKKPSISGTAKVGNALKAHTGTWNTTPRSFSYQWQRNGKSIKGATSASYRLVAADAGKRITVKVTGTRSNYTSGNATTAQTRKVAKGTLKSTKPRITGTPRVGKTLSVKRGSWTSGTKITYRWLRNGVPIKGATSAKHRLTSKDAGSRITVRVTGKKSGYTSKQKFSSRTGRVTW